MKKLFTLFVLVGFSIGMASAQDKTSSTRSVESKSSLKKVEPVSNTAVRSKFDKKSDNAKRSDSFMTQEQFDAHRKEVESNPKTSTKPKSN